MNETDLQSRAEKERTLQARFRHRVLCCTSTACLASGAAEVRAGFTQAVKLRQLAKDVQLVNVGCMGLCSRGPMVRLQTPGEADVLYQDLTRAVAERIVHDQLAPAPPTEIAETSEEHPVALEPLDIPPDRASLDPARPARELEAFILPQDIPFFTRQMKVALSNAGVIDPERIEDYMAHGGYRALAKALTTLTPEQVCGEIQRSGLRGRGGAGYSTGLKWHQVRRSPGETKYVVANGDEGDPGAYMDRTLMEADPHRVLEGMIIAGYAVGAQQGYLYVRGEYPIAVKRLERALRAAYRNGLLGKDLFGSGFSFEASIRIGAGAFVCGEETALMASVEGRRGMPVIRPPYPAQRGLWGHPTLINNVETFANIAPILLRGADWFASIGTEKSKGTKVFALTGKLTNTGLIEVPMGITLREIVEVIGGGVPDGHNFKAAQTGGPSGGCIPAEHLDTPMTYESLQALGSIMGSGGLIVIDDTSRMPDVAQFFMDFCVDESCGKCLPCRVGTVQMLRLLQKINGRRAAQADLEKLEHLCQIVRQASLCGLGQTAPNPVLSTLRYFRAEYEDLLVEAPAQIDPAVESNRC